MVSGLLKFILGFLLAIAVLVGSGVAVALYFMNRTAIPPTKPTYANDSPALQTSNPQKTDLNTTPTPNAIMSPTPSATPTESSEALPPGAYQGRVTWSEGLSLRAEPKQDAERVGSVAFKQNIIVLEENQDKSWLKIRIEGSKQEGWVKAGNIERVN
ncbi:SH3 domain-containing protein [Nostoc sp. UHCC 0870]|uniref:SH3 domain-containing protein n=1 Tax=Nostoc sp. UHCC 0870 TaxID=2914041 RepID=UPI001EE0C45B|nr:SH3 domain-containing protein [Nostoc sp. UHCC 0870]UKP00868.1 SH3 domain-containing protein [Nostoc sp. UHCC 0870]